MLNLIFGNKGYGKTALCFNVIKEQIQNKTHTFFIVPEQQAVKAERSMAELLSDESNLYVEVINFKRLCNRIFRECGGLSRTHADKAAKLLCLAKAQRDCNDLLKMYKSNDGDTGFTKKLASCFGAFENCALSPSLLMKLSEKVSQQNNSTLSDKLFDLSLIFGTYRDTLEENFGWNCDLLYALNETLDKYLFFKDKCVVIDSFFGFTQAELDIIEKIIRSAKDVYITFSYDGKKTDELYTRSINAYRYIKKICESYNIKYNCVYLEENLRHKKDSGLFLLQDYFRLESLGSTTDLGEKSDISIISCSDSYKECYCAANIISKLIRDGNSYSDICVCVPDSERYSGIIDTVFEKHSIPFYVSKKEKLLEKPVISLVFSAFDVYLSSFARNHITRFLKSGLCGLDFKEAGLLDKYIRTWNLKGSRFKVEHFENNPSGYCETMTEKEAEDLYTINSAHKKIMSLLLPFCDKLKKGKNAIDFSSAIYELLCDVHGINGADSFFEADNASFYQMIYDALDTICTVYKNDRLNAKSFYKLLELCISCYDLGAIPSSLDEVEIAPVSLVRCDNVKYVIVMGANEGVLPNVNGQDTFFADSEKDILEQNNIYLSPKSTNEIYDGLFLCMSTCLSAKNGLYILYANRDFSGEKLNASVFVSILCNIFPNNKVKNYPYENSMENLCNEFVAFEQLFSTKDNSLRRSLEKYFENNPRFCDALNLLNKDFDAKEKLSGDVTLSLYKDKMISSVTRLDTFNRCPFSYFSRYTLNLAAELDAKLGPSQIGNISHRVMEIFCKKLAQKKSCDGSVYTPNQAEDVVREILSQYLDMFLPGLDKVSKRFMFLYNKISKNVMALAKNITKEMAQSLFCPCDFELSIGKGSKVEPVALNVTKDGKAFATLEIIGQVDRIDICSINGKKCVRVIDYKTGVKTFDPAEIAYGLNLQMLIYLYTVINSKSNIYGETPVPSAVLYLLCAPPSKTVYLGQQQEEKDRPFTTEGIVVADMDIVKAMERDVEGKFIPVTLKQNGEFTARSSIIALNGMKELLNVACEAAATLAGEIMSGDISVSPYKCEDLNACVYCDYNSFCGFDKELHTPRYELVKKGGIKNEN